MKTLSGLCLTVSAFLVFGLAATLWAYNANYNRPNPLMDYVPQEIGIYDTVYEEQQEADCRNCHGNSLADRHHMTDPVVIYGTCIPCHEVVDDPPYVVVTRDCLTGGCHSSNDLATNGWHHATDMSASGDCVACHNPNLIEEITGFRDLVGYPPSIVTPTPFSCENCHWQQMKSSTWNPNNPGHPSTYDHYNAVGGFVGFYEYSKPIYGNFDTHHMNFEGNVSFHCYECHSTDPNQPDWDPYEPELIRYCEICHSPETLHAVYPHVHDTNGWEAVGLHVPGVPDNLPSVYRTWQPTGPYTPEESPGFTADQMCFGCHGDNIPEPPAADDCTGNLPVIDNTSEGIQPSQGPPLTRVTIRGQNFGEEENSLRKVQMKLRDDPGSTWVNLPVLAWTDNLIEFQIAPLWDFQEAGNYSVRVKTECGNSNKRIFSLHDWISVDKICVIDALGCRQDGPCGTWLRVEGFGFGDKRFQMKPDGYNGVHRIVDFVSSQGTFTATTHRNWSNTSFEVWFQNFFEDGIDPVSGERNFVQDDGSGSCLREPTLKKCTNLAVGPLSLYAIAIYYGDDDASGDLSCGDTIFQVVTSDPQYFELTAEPQVNKLYPTKIERGNVLKILGLNFGPQQMDGEVRVGLKTDAQDPTLGKGKLLDTIRSWSNTRIKVNVKLPPKWEGKTRYVWVEKAGTKSNYKALEILAPLP
jgi:hypothetical protein